MKPNEHLLVQDLLPSYVDGLTCTETADYVRAHLEVCAVCRASCEAMQRPCAPKPCEPPPEVHYLKRLRGRLGGNNLVWIFLILAVTLGMLLQRFVPVPTAAVDVQRLYWLSSGKLYCEVTVAPPYSAADLPFRSQAAMVDVQGGISLSYSVSPLNWLVERGRGEEASPVTYTYVFDPAQYDLPAGGFTSLQCSWRAAYKNADIYWDGGPLPAAPPELDARWRDYQGNELAQWSKALSQRFDSPT